MLRVGLTGNIGSGKSTVAAVWAGLGAPVVSADELARRVVQPGAPALARVAEAFGAAVIAADGTLDRAALRELVFEDAGARARLESILHPEIARLREAEEATLTARGEPLAVFEIPLLFEAGLEDAVDVIVLVDAPEADRIARIVATRGIDTEQARRMAAAQLAADEKRRRADIIINNAGTIAALEREAEEVWNELKRRATASA